MPKKAAGLANLKPPVKTTEEARALAQKRWGDKPRGRKNKPVQVTIPTELLELIAASGENRSKLVTRLLREWAKRNTTSRI